MLCQVMCCVHSLKLLTVAFVNWVTQCCQMLFYSTYNFLLDTRFCDKHIGFVCICDYFEEKYVTFLLTFWGLMYKNTYILLFSYEILEYFTASVVFCGFVNIVFKEKLTL